MVGERKKICGIMGKNGGIGQEFVKEVQKESAVLDIKRL